MMNTSLAILVSSGNNFNYTDNLEHGIHEPSKSLYDYYKAFLSTLINVNSSTLNKKVFVYNNLWNTGKNSIHEKFIHYGKSVADLSIGDLEYPWVGADFSKNNQIDLVTLDRRAAIERNPIVSAKLWAISEFTRSLKPNPTIFMYEDSKTGLLSITLIDELNNIRFNYIPTELGV